MDQGHDPYLKNLGIEECHDFSLHLQRCLKEIGKSHSTIWLPHKGGTFVDKTFVNSHLAKYLSGPQLGVYRYI